MSYLCSTPTPEFVTEMRVARSIEKVSVLVVIGVTENGQKQVIGIQSGDKESASSWRETFKDLKLRGFE
jgi:putative transposase